jgi:Flp pilus assembly pilin Flp
MTHLQLIFGRLAFGALELRRSAASRQQGQALIEYALIISLIAVLAIAALQLTGTNVKGLLNKIAGEV